MAGKHSHPGYKDPLKGFVDRFSYFNCPENKKKIRGKYAVIAIPYEETSPETAKPLHLPVSMVVVYYKEEY